MPRRRLVLLALIVVVGLAGSGIHGAFFGDAGTETGSPDPRSLIQPGDAEHYLWPYTSRTRTVEGRTLAINVVIHGEPDRVETALRGTLDGNWTDVEGDEPPAVDAANVTNDTFDPDWGVAQGAARYTYITTDPGATGTWITADYQLASGTYFGHRTHIRAYTSSAIGWTALQAHEEYWDWYRLRHTVTGVAPGARVVEQDLRHEPGVDTISRIYHGMKGGGSDGWLTVIELAALVLVGSVVPARPRAAHAKDVGLPVALAGIVLGVRSLGLGLEAAAPGMNPHLITAALYPILVVGPPIAVTLLAPNRPVERVLAGTFLGLGAGFLLDFGAVGVSMVPVPLVLHRLALIGALGIFALGIARSDRTTFLLGTFTWLLVLGAALVGFV